MDLSAKILRQLEYYFSDRNLYRDKFLNSQIEKNPEKWVPISVLLTFNRLKSLTMDPKLLCDSISNSTLIESDQNGENIRRIPSNPMVPLTKEHVEDERSRTVHIAGFPTETKMDDLLTFMDEFGPYLDLRMCREKKKFKGSVFCVFENVEGAKNFVEKEEILFKDISLSRQFSRDFYANQEDLKECQSQKSQLDQIKAESCLIFAENLPTEAKVKEIRAFFNFHVPTSFVDLSSDGTGVVRFQTDQTPEAVRDQIMCAVDGKLVMDGSEISLRPVTEEESGEFWKKFGENLEKGRKDKKQKKESGKGVRPNKRKIFEEEEDGPPAAKVPRLENS